MERKAQAAKAAKASQSKQKQAEASKSKQKQALEPTRVEVQNEFHTSWRNACPSKQQQAKARTDFELKLQPSNSKQQAVITIATLIESNSKQRQVKASSSASWSLSSKWVPHLVVQTHAQANKSKQMQKLIENF